jgi:hypothetical protein
MKARHGSPPEKTLTYPAGQPDRDLVSVRHSPFVNNVNLYTVLLHLGMSKRKHSSG